MGSIPSRPKSKYTTTSGSGNKQNEKHSEDNNRVSNGKAKVGFMSRIHRKPKSESDVSNKLQISALEDELGQSVSTLTLRSSYDIKTGESLRNEDANAEGRHSDYKKSSLRSPTPYPRIEEEHILDDLKSTGIIKVTNMDLFNRKKEEMARSILAELRQIGLASDAADKVTEGSTPHHPPRLAPIDKEDIRRKKVNKELGDADDLLDDIDTELEKVDKDYLSKGKEKFLNAAEKRDILARIPEETGTGNSPRVGGSKGPYKLSPPKKFIPPKPARKDFKSKYSPTGIPSVIC